MPVQTLVQAPEACHRRTEIPMPTLHPAQPRLPAHLKSEQDVLAAPRTLPPETHVFARLGILDPESNKDRELDFLVLHPDLGLVIVEVKGKGVEPRGDHWIRRQDGLEKPLEEAPGEQLQAQQWALVHFLQREAPGFIPQVTRVLALPELPLGENQDLGPDLPACRILTRAKLARPFESLRMAVSGGEAWQAWRTRPESRHHELRPDRLAALLEALTPGLLPPAPLADLLAAEGRLQDAQSRFLLDHLARNFTGGRFHVTGAPGSGKSLLARQTTRLWASEGRRVLAVAFNRALTYATQGALDDLIQWEQVHVSTYHDLAANLLHQAGQPAQGTGDADFFNRVLPERLAAVLEAPEGHRLPRWDALVVDEAQDLDPAWIRPLLRLLRHPDSDPVLLLEDPAQGLYRQGCHDLGQPWRLDLNLRQHPALRRAACLAFPGCGWEAPEAGEADGILRRLSSSPRTWREDLARELTGLAAEGLSPGQVMVLAPHRAQTLKVVDGSVLGPWPLNSEADWWEGDKTDHVRFGTVQGFKGLEADVVIYLAPAYRRPDGPRLAYTAYSRARHRLIVLEQALAEPTRPRPGPVQPPLSQPRPPALPQVRALPADQQARLLEALTAAKGRKVGRTSQASDL